MWWPSRSRAALAVGIALLAALPGCGFQPLYGTHAGQPAAGEQLANVAIDVIPDRNGQVLRNLLIDRFYRDGRPAAPSYRLAVQLQAFEENLGIRPDATATRARLRLFANYQLIDNAGKVAFRASSRSIVSYDILDAQYATLAGQQDAYQRGLTELSDEIRTRLALHFTRPH
jgi:LPS-assembly lipoprotein